MAGDMASEASQKAASFERHVISCNGTLWRYKDVKMVNSKSEKGMLELPGPDQLGFLSDLTHLMTCRGLSLRVISF